MADLTAPTANWVDPHVMMMDPYDTYEKLRAESPVTWVPAVNKYLITGYPECHSVELDQTVFSARVSGSGATMIRALGENPMLRKDDPEHAVERQAINPTLRPRSVTQVWAPIFDRNADRFLAALSDAGPDKADLNRDFAAPLASQNLIDMLGLPGVDTTTMSRWSHALIAGTGNLLDDARIWDAADTARTEIDELLADLIPHYAQHPDHSITSALVASGLPHRTAAANVKLTIAGGMNEPQHMVTNMVWALDNHPDQRRHVQTDPSSWTAVFDETARWLSPIGMYPRETTCETVLGGIALPAGAPLGVVVAAANRDPRHVADHPELFDIHRPKLPHLAFGSGVHLCAGHWAAKSSIGQIAVPKLFDAFPTLRVDHSRETQWNGWVFRGLTTLPITWDD
ncbi:cytochrome P450 [Rhodococcoides trifolii]|uniref:Cytochrome P450 n=1 Tax=Rhodococcoides trifolii TaxID=908250 RepID=A0A917G898_9NOCA|nr:cytochrome P450 [Rhodococcus trifolii]GGG26930.1 cytochrome P450 [Rhodococcus trifolii]